MGVDFRVKAIRLLEPRGTGDALDMDRRIACLVPTTIAVYETEDLDVYMSYLRPSWARKIFGSRTADMLGELAKDALGAE